MPTESEQAEADNNWQHTPTEFPGSAPVAVPTPEKKTRSWVSEGWFEGVAPGTLIEEEEYGTRS